MRRAILMTAAAALIGGAAYAWQVVEPANMETVTYVTTVEAGDTIWDLAARLAADRDDIRDVVRAIKAQNGITDAAALRPGQTLRVTVERIK